MKCYKTKNNICKEVVHFSHLPYLPLGHPSMTQPPTTDSQPKDSSLHFAFSGIFFLHWISPCRNVHLKQINKICIFHSRTGSRFHRNCLENFIVKKADDLDNQIILCSWLSKIFKIVGFVYQCFLSLSVSFPVPIQLAIEKRQIVFLQYLTDCASRSICVSDINHSSSHGGGYRLNRVSPSKANMSEISVSQLHNCKWMNILVIHHGCIGGINGHNILQTTFPTTQPERSNLNINIFSACFRPELEWLWIGCDTFYAYRIVYWNRYVKAKNDEAEKEIFIISHLPTPGGALSKNTPPGSTK